MPEYPDIELYVASLRPRLTGFRLEKWLQKDPFVLRSVDPAPSELTGKAVTGLRRLGKRIVIEFEEDLAMVIHLMIAGRFRWAEMGKKPQGGTLISWTFGPEGGTLGLTEAGTKRRAKVYVVRGAAGVEAHNPGGMEVVGSRLDDFVAVLRSHKHTLKRILTDPKLFSGIGNAYSDEILLQARLSPVRMSTALKDDEAERLWSVCCTLLPAWRVKLIAEWNGKFPTTVTAFHKDMAAHGKFEQPCPQCAHPIQRIRYADNETNYCAFCQTGGKLLADRSLSRLLKSDWPRSLDEMEDHVQQRKEPS